MKYPRLFTLSLCLLFACGEVVPIPGRDAAPIDAPSPADAAMPDAAVPVPDASMVDAASDNNPADAGIDRCALPGAIDWVVSLKRNPEQVIADSLTFFGDHGLVTAIPNALVLGIDGAGAADATLSGNEAIDIEWSAPIGLVDIIVRGKDVDGNGLEYQVESSDGTRMLTALPGQRVSIPGRRRYMTISVSGADEIKISQFEYCLL